MYAEPLRTYESALLGRNPLTVCIGTGQLIELDLERWLAPADEADATVLARCSGPVLDVGCGPGRFVAALVERGVSALGLDIARTAIDLGRSRGLPTLRRSVYSRIPGEGHWASVLLIDGNIGIGGDSRRLLARSRQLLRSEGLVVVETDRDAHADRCETVRFAQHGQPIGPRFSWARLGARPLLRDAAGLGYRVSERWTADGRTFVALRTDDST